jgi:hypothetical protein
MGWLFNCRISRYAPLAVHTHILKSVTGHAITHGHLGYNAGFVSWLKHFEDQTVA